MLQKLWTATLRDFRTYLTLERRLSPNSIEAYLNDVRHLERLGLERRLKPTELSADDLRELVAIAVEADIAVATQCRLISGWRLFFRWLEVEDLVADNPADLVAMPTKPQHLPDVLSDADISAIQATFDLSLPDQARNYVIVEILYGCGLRVSELVAMTLANIYPDEMGLHIVGKGNKERWVPVNEHAMELLQTYITTIRSHYSPLRGEEHIVFLSRLGRRLSRNYVFMFLRDAAKQAGVAKRVSPHSLRHSFATELVQNGADLRAVQEMFGHENIATTEIYTHLTTKILRDTITLHHPHYQKK